MLRRLSKVVPSMHQGLRSFGVFSKLLLPFQRSALRIYSGSLESPRLRYFSTNSISEKEFHVVCDDTLEMIQDELSDLETQLNDADVSLSQGVLNINLGPTLGTWVINKQTPNRQIWWSSPISGPRRYEYHPDPTGKLALLDVWKYSKDGTTLRESLQKEMLKATGNSLFQE